MTVDVLEVANGTLSCRGARVAWHPGNAEGQGVVVEGGQIIVAVTLSEEAITKSRFLRNP